jgi:uncharacterized protein
MQNYKMEDYLTGERVELQLFTTLGCNLACKYCSEEDGGVRGSQVEIEYSLDELNAFVEKHFKDKEIIVTFYGGEPLLNIPFIKEVMERFPLWRYQLQTNGTLLKNIKAPVLAQFDSILISIDGKKGTTDSFRGDGVYNRILDNLPYVKDSTDAYLTGRCTWGSPQTTAEDILHLLELFDYTYFQFPHTEWIYTDQYVDNAKSTLESLTKQFFQSKRLLRVVPLMGICRNILFPSRAKELYGGKTQCKVSSHLFNILPNGQIAACPDYAHDASMLHGSVKENYCNRNPLQYSDNYPCNECSAYDVCRINCVMGLHRAYIQNDVRYRESVVEPTCSLIRFLFSLVKENDVISWYSSLLMRDKRELRNSPLYEYVEIIP